MHIAISGYYGFDNIGDEAVLYGIIQALRHYHPDVELTVLSNTPKKTALAYDVRATNRWNLKEVFQTIRKADGLISGGGSLLQDKTGIKTIPYYVGVMRIAHFLKKPVFIYGQGMGPIQRWYSKWLVKHVISKSCGITVRDEHSKVLLENLGIQQPVYVVPDPVLGLSIPDGGMMGDEREDDGRVLAVSVRDWPSPYDFKRKIAVALDRCVDEGFSVRFVPMHGEVDDKTSREVAGMMENPCAIYPCHASIKEKIGFLAGADILLGMRLHSLVFSALSFTPFVALSYDPKIDAFTEQCGQPLIGHVENDNWDCNTIVTEVKNTMADIEKRREALSRMIIPMKRKSVETARMALGLFQNNSVAADLKEVRF